MTPGPHLSLLDALRLLVRELIRPALTAKQRAELAQLRAVQAARRARPTRRPSRQRLVER